MIHETIDSVIFSPSSFSHEEAARVIADAGDRLINGRWSLTRRGNVCLLKSTGRNIRDIRFVPDHVASVMLGESPNVTDVIVTDTIAITYDYSANGLGVCARIDAYTYCEAGAGSPDGFPKISVRFQSIP